MRYYRFLLESVSDQPECIGSSTEHFAITEEDGTTWLYLPLSSSEEACKIMSKTPSFIRFEETDIKDYVDWGVQWSDHSPDFKDYTLQVDLSKYTSLAKKFPILKLDAGPGFGDLSHPTTRLTLAMMAQHVQNKNVIDIGCGSGILTLASILLGAKWAYGIDIDKDALLHAQKNATLNGLEGSVEFGTPDKNMVFPSEDLVLVMNMIRSQQQEAWASLPQLHSVKAICFTSGILVTERKQYLEECIKRGWKLIEESQQGDWMAFQMLLSVEA